MDPSFAAFVATLGIAVMLAAALAALIFGLVFTLSHIGSQILVYRNANVSRIKKIAKVSEVESQWYPKAGYTITLPNGVKYFYLESGTFSSEDERRKAVRIDIPTHKQQKHLSAYLAKRAAISKLKKQKNQLNEIIDSTKPSDSL